MNKPPVLSAEQKRILRQLFPEEQLLLHPNQCLPYSYDNNSQHRVIPQAVVFARDETALLHLVQYCRQWRLPITCRGKGTGTAGAAVPTPGGIVVSFERMDEILEIDAANRLARVQPGVSNARLQHAVAQEGFFWAPDPTSAQVCTIGGNLACNAAGPRAVKYGSCRENTLGLTAITGQGQRIRTGVKTTKGVVGYDLTRLIIGSEGTLAIITEAILKLTPLPEAKRTLQAIYPNVEQAARAVSAIMAQPVVPSALEFMDAQALKMVQNFADAGLPEAAGALLMIEVEDSKAAIDAAADKIRQTALPGSLRVDIAHTRAQVQRLWKVRKALSPALRNVAPKKINEDVVVPVSRIPDLIGGLERLAREFAITIVNFGHAGNGNIHVNLLIDPDDERQAQAAEACLAEVFKLVLSLDGSLSGEHGIGWVKKAFVNQEIEAASLQLMHAIKQQFDPDGILNPDKSLPRVST